MKEELKYKKKDRQYNDPKKGTKGQTMIHCTIKTLHRKLMIEQCESN
jgi:hypothetical protein